MTQNNISHLKNCYGCGVCSIACPCKIISIRLNENGFYEPYIFDKAKCVHCGACIDVCAFSHDVIANDSKGNIKSWAAWSNNDQIRSECSSGGISFEIGQQLIMQGYKVVGCRYNVNAHIAEHYIAKSVEELKATIGSKYIQSYTVTAFKQIDLKQKYLIVGSPCQIDSFRRLVHRFHCEQNFILIDFYCHCVPSMYVWNAYIEMIKSQVGKITKASWRNKFTGWHDSWAMGIEGDKGQWRSWMSRGDLFYKLFLGDYYAAPQCQSACKYKLCQSSADIRIGDLWGDTYGDDEKGVSALVAFTEKGRRIINELKGVSLVEHPIDVVTEGQMKSNVHQVELAPFVHVLLRHGVSLKNPLYKGLFFMQLIINKLKNIFS